MRGERWRKVKRIRRSFLCHHLRILAARKSFLEPLRRRSRSIAPRPSTLDGRLVHRRLLLQPALVGWAKWSLIINRYWTKLSKISWFVSGEQISYLPKPETEANNLSVSLIIVSITQFFFFFFFFIFMRSVIFHTRACLLRLSRSVFGAKHI